MQEKELKLHLLDNYLKQTCGGMTETDTEMLQKVFELENEDVETAIQNYWEEMKQIDGKIDAFLDKLQDFFIKGLSVTVIGQMTGLSIPEIEKIQHWKEDKDRMRKALNFLFDKEEELLAVIDKVPYLPKIKKTNSIWAHLGITKVRLLAFCVQAYFTPILRL